MIRKNKIPTILGIILLFGGVFAGVFLLRNNQIFKIGASPTITPQNVRLSNFSDSSVTISWITDDKTASFVSYGVNENVGDVISETEDDQKFSTHSITITGLNPETNYYFKINSDGTTFDNNGIPWQFATGKTLPMNQTTIPISGSIITASGEAVGRAVVYITVSGYTLSTVTSESGTFVLQLGSVRTPDLAGYAQIVPAKTLLEVSATTQDGEVATAKIFAQSANPIPALVVGRDQDFRSLEPSLDGDNPNADLNLPKTASTESKFNISGKKTEGSKTVTLESVSEGEIVSSDKPEFFGDGPAGTKINISVHSETPVSGTSTVSSTGSWSWSPPSNLSPGTHSVTISWIDTSGIKRTLTRNFIVQAGELPAFVATPSAITQISTPTPTATPARTSTPRPTNSATPTATPIASKSPTPKPTKTPTPTTASLPQSGSLTPTILLFMMGLAVIMFSFSTWNVSNRKP